MNIIHKTVADMTGTEYRAAYLANYGSGGYMREELVNARADSVDAARAKVILLWDGPDDKTRSLIGWALLTPVKLYGPAQGTRYTMRVSKYTAQFWVKRQHRRKGYGKTLMLETKKHDLRPHVIPHDGPSRELFSSFNVTVLRDELCWLRKKPKVA